MAKRDHPPSRAAARAVDAGIEWFDARFPLIETWEYHLSKYWAPKNFNVWYLFGVLSVVVLVNQASPVSG